MAQLALDDPAALKKLLEDCAVPAPTVANLNLLGYRSVALLGFAVPSDGHAKGGIPCEPNLATAAKPKLSLSEYKELKLKFVEHFPGELLTPESTPSFMFLASLKEQVDAGTWTWTPWRHRISEHAEMLFQENRKPRSDHQLLQRMLNQQELMDFPEASVPSGGPDMQTALQPRPRSLHAPTTPKKVEPKATPKKPGTPPPVRKDDRLKDWNESWVRKTFAPFRRLMERLAHRSILPSRTRVLHTDQRTKGHLQLWPWSRPLAIFLWELGQVHQPPSLWLWTVFLPYLSRHSKVATLQAWPSCLPSTFTAQPLTQRVEDGGGLISTAVWHSPQAPDVLGGLRKRWTSRILRMGLHSHILSHFATGSKDPPLSDHQLQGFLMDVREFVDVPDQIWDQALPVAPGQPFRLDLWRLLLREMNDPDIAFLDELVSGVRLGVNNDIPASSLWPLQQSTSVKVVRVANFTLRDREHAKSLHFKSRRIWLGIQIPGSSKRKLLPDTHEALQAWKDVLIGTPFLHDMVPPHHIPLQASADACATANEAGLGGVIRMNGSVMAWFAFTISHSEAKSIFPWVSDSMQKHINVWELLGQFSLAYCLDCSLKGRHTPIAVTFACDNTSAEAAHLKALSTSAGMCHILAAFFRFQRIHNIDVTIQHIPGIWNDDADALSRGRHIPSCTPELRIEVPWKWLCSAIPKFSPSQARIPSTLLSR
ncbi:unnamed protein product [Cladocopium goreaui]|uniref:Reverse transcriptase domain-containing protein n=1 Tax=Cladocopium goreaui TaxID=2562237 RepID=A0A9P1CKV5_9DINO|nr:unnamed protein product [Cladocopium goreaui]